MSKEVNKDCISCTKKLICTKCKRQICHNKNQEECKIDGYYMYPKGPICQKCKDNKNQALSLL